MLPKVRWGLRGRAISLIVLLLLASVGGLVASLLWRAYRNDVRRMGTQAIVHAQTVGRLAEPALLLNDRPALARIARAAAYADVCRVVIADREGRTLASFQRSPNFAAEVDVDLSQPESRAGMPEAGLVRRSAQQLAVAVPIQCNAPALDLGMLDEASTSAAGPSGPVGFACLTYSLGYIREELTGRVVTSALMAAVVLAVGTIVTLLAVRSLLRPVHDLVQVTAAIAAGDRGKRASEQAYGEVGDLARAFNYMADRLQESYTSIEQKIDERTAALESALRAAQAADVAKSEFLANMSHEIRTPMTAILGFADLLLEPANVAQASPEQAEAAKTIKSNGEYLLGIINDILDLSKIEAGKMTTERVECSPCQVVADVASLMRVRASAKGLPLRIEYEGPIPERIRTDPTRLRQILVNVVANAIKFTETGCVRLICRLADQVPRSTRDQAGSAIEFDVVDTGIGISPDQAPKLFRPFTQADNSTTRRFGGTGLGLTISKRLAQMLDGDVMLVEAKPGAGTRFRISVATGPLAGVPMIANPIAATTLVHDKAGNPSGHAELTLRGCRILLAEDGPDNRRLILHLLSQVGAVVTMVEDGQLAVDAALAAHERGTPFDLILMDMQMPVLDGYDATRLLRGQGYKHPIVALTAHAMQGDRARCVAAGCDDYSTKPIDRKQLINTILRQIVKSAALCAG